MAGRIRAHDWATTPLGPAEGWPQSLKTAVDIMLGSGVAMQLAWGSNRTVLYNDACISLLGDRHPGTLGKSFLDSWPVNRGQVESLVERVFAGEAARIDELPLVRTRHDLSEDMGWTACF